MPYSTDHHISSDREAGLTLASVLQLLVVIGLLVGLFLMGGSIKDNASATMVISRVKKYDTAVRQFRAMYGALPGDITNARSRLPNCMELPCAAPGNGDNVIADRKLLLTSPFYFRDTSENRTFWLHMAVNGQISDVSSTAAKGKYFGQWGVEFPGAPFGVAGGFHIAYYSVRSTAYNRASLLGHYLVLRGSTDTYGAGVAPYSLTPKISALIDKKMDDGKPAMGRVVSLGAATCSQADDYNTSALERACNTLFQLSF